MLGQIQAGSRILKTGSTDPGSGAKFSGYATLIYLDIEPEEVVEHRLPLVPAEHVHSVLTTRHRPNLKDETNNQNQI